MPEVFKAKMRSNAQQIFKGEEKVKVKKLKQIFEQRGQCRFELKLNTWKGIIKKWNLR